jgi:diacylglycerol kinase family enzyme
VLFVGEPHPLRSCDRAFEMPTEDPGGTEHPPSSVPPPSRRVAVVVNGNAKGVDDEVIGTLDQILLGGDLFVSRRREDCQDIARTVVSRGYGTVLTGGGDGTFTVVVTEVVREARRRGRPLPRVGLLRLGTGNALAWVVGASRARGRGLAADIQRLYEDAGSRPLRLIEVEGFIAPFCGFGADALVLADYSAVKDALERTPLRRWAPGPLSFFLAAVTRTMPGHLVRPVPHCRITNAGADAFRVGARGQLLGPAIVRGEVIYEGPIHLASLSTIPFLGFGFRFFPYADDREDRMQLRVSTLGVRSFVRHFSAIWRGDFDDPETMFDYLVEAVTIETDPPTPFQIGGDLQGERSRVEVKLTPHPIRLVDFYAPPSAS